MYNDVCVRGVRGFAVSFHDSVSRVKFSVQLVLREKGERGRTRGEGGRERIRCAFWGWGEEGFFSF